MIYFLEPFTKTMLAQLQRVRDIELSEKERNICIPDDFKRSLAGLFRRGFVNTKTVTREGKEIPSIYITKAGRIFLDKEEAKKIGSAYNIV